MVQTSKHVRFDEGINNLEYPNARNLRLALGRPLQANPEDAITLLPPSFEAQDSPFLSIQDVNVIMSCEHDTLGMDPQTCLGKDWVYLSNMNPGTSGSRMKGQIYF